MFEQNQETRPTAVNEVTDTQKRNSDTQGHDEAREQQRQASSTDTSSLSTRQSRSRMNCLAWLRSLSAPLILENSGSVARDHLACERTFLAYVRTSLACAATGVALVQLILDSDASVHKFLERFGKIMATVIGVFGLGIMLAAVCRYFNMQKLLTDGKFPPAEMVVWMIVFATAIIILATFGLMLGVALT